MKKVVIVAAVAAVVLFGIGVDLVHCLVIGAAIFTTGIVILMLGRVPADDDPPDPLLIPYSTSLLRGYAFSDPRSKDPVGEFAGRRAAQVCDQALMDYPDDPVLTRIDAQWGDAWRTLPQRTLTELLDRVDALRAPRSTDKDVSQ